MNESLAAVREVWAQRAEARSRGDVLYLVYVVVLSVAIIGVPALREAGVLLARPDVLPLLLLGRAPQASTAIALAGAAALVMLGAVRGPALLSAFFTSSLASSGLRRRAVLWRPFARALLVPVLTMVITSGLIAVTLMTAGHAGVVDLLLFVLAAAGSGLLLGVAWLAGQLLGTAARRVLALLLAGVAVGAVLLPAGVGLGGVYPARGASPEAWAGVSAVAGILAVGIAVPLLDQLRGSVLREQAIRWESAMMIATTTDLAGATETFRLPPSTGRRLRAIGPGPLVLLYARRDMVTWLRSPERLVLAVLAALLASAGIGASTMITGPLSWGALALGALTLWAAAGSVLDGLRHGVHTLGAPQLFGQSAGAQMLLHVPAPLILLLMVAALGGAGIGAVTGTGVTSEAVLLPLALAPVLVAGRARDAAKGSMPLALSTPMPTPQGDLSVLLMLAWQSDAIVLALVSAAMLLLAAPLGASWLVGLGVALTALKALMAWKRLRALGE